MKAFIDTINSENKKYLYMYIETNQFIISFYIHTSKYFLNMYSYTYIYISFKFVYIFFVYICNCSQLYFIATAVAHASATVASKMPVVLRLFFNLFFFFSCDLLLLIDIVAVVVFYFFKIIYGFNIGLLPSISIKNCLVAVAHVMPFDVRCCFLYYIMYVVFLLY